MFILPEKYRPSKPVEPGESFEAIAKVVAQDDGTFHVTEVDGLDLTKKEDNRFEELTRPPAGDLAGSYS